MGEDVVRLLLENEQLKRQRDDLMRSNNELLDRARKAEGAVSQMLSSSYVEREQE